MILCLNIPKDIFNYLYRELKLPIAGLCADGKPLETFADIAGLATTRPALAGVAVPQVPEAWLRTVASWFEPAAEIPVFTGRTAPLESMPDSALLDLLVRHPIALEALASAAGSTLPAVEQRLAPLVAAGRLAIEDNHGIRTARAVNP